MNDSDYEDYSGAESESLFTEDSIGPCLEIENDSLRRQLDNLNEFIEAQNSSFTNFNEAVQRHPAYFGAISRVRFTLLRIKLLFRILQRKF